MARTRKWGSEAERLAAYRSRQTVQPEAQSVRIEAETVRIDDQRPVRIERPGFVRFVHQPHVPLSLFDGYGRGTVRQHSDGRRYVMVARHDGPDLGELGIVTAADWQARLGRRCGHGLAGWQCHTC